MNNVETKNCIRNQSSLLEIGTERDEKITEATTKRIVNLISDYHHIVFDYKNFHFFISYIFSEQRNILRFTQRKTGFEHLKLLTLKL